MGLGADAGHLIPVHITVEPDPDPAPMAHVRRPEEAAWVRASQLLLGTRRRGAPQVQEQVVVVPGRPQHDKLPVGEERLGPVSRPFLRTWQRQADIKDPVLDRRGIRLGRAHSHDVRSVASADGLDAAAAT
jgi:hypothetical protein